MLDGFQYVIGQIGVVLAITALLAALLGWFVGRGSRRRNEEALERAIASVTRSATDASAFAPSDAATQESDDATVDLEGDDEFPTHRLPYGVAPIDHVPLRDGESGTVIRPAPEETDGTLLRPRETTVLRAQESTALSLLGEGTVIRPAEDGTVLRSVDDGTVIRPADEGTVLRPVREGTVIRPAAQYDSGTVIRSVPGVTRDVTDPGLHARDDRSSLRPDPRDPDLQVGVIEAAALAAWDRTVPMLEQQLKDLAAQNDELRHMLRDAQERLETDVTAHLRAVSVEGSAPPERRARA